MSQSAKSPNATAPELISVIIPAYNGLPDIVEQLDALAAQDSPPPFEVVVSDNGSTDGLADVLHAYPHRSRLRLRCVDSSATQGTPHARNAGIDAAQGDFLLFTDQDDRVHPGWVAAMSEAAREFDAVGGPIEVQTLNSPRVASWRIVPAPDERFETAYLPFAHGNNFGMWRHVVDRIGQFDEAFVGGGEDGDLSWRIQQAGMTLGHAPDAMVAYRLRTTMKATWRQALAYGRSSAQLTQKHRENGCPRRPITFNIAWNLRLLATNPLLPQRLSRFPRGLWVLAAGVQVGKATERARHEAAQLGGLVRGRQVLDLPTAHCGDWLGACDSGAHDAQRGDDAVDEIALAERRDSRRDA
ncbi:glycosyltransferase [Antrihabitans cavernicola]|uniref:Glycosyltransferase n=1 Tax=Antrihabitans cavernicola TaxID=2495913 RepID=A0A5A7SBH5_9NOCA|nr:glycosyltransferase [Spelaeibacter cavernicola]KAA0022894.1 glycosyltransferase [Spelaeibacter cavernicola]